MKDIRPVHVVSVSKFGWVLQGRVCCGTEAAALFVRNLVNGPAEEVCKRRVTIFVLPLCSLCLVVSLFVCASALGEASCQLVRSIALSASVPCNADSANGLQLFEVSEIS